MKTLVASIACLCVGLVVGANLQTLTAPWFEETPKANSGLLLPPRPPRPQGRLVELPEQRLVVRRFVVTAYCRCSACIPGTSNPVSASGWAYDNPMVAADPSLPFGTKISVPGFLDGRQVGVYDRRPGAIGDRIAVLMPGHAEAVEWGRRVVDCVVHERFPEEE